MQQLLDVLSEEYVRVIRAEARGDVHALCEAASELEATARYIREKACTGTDTGPGEKDPS